MATRSDPPNFEMDLDNLCLWRRTRAGAPERVKLTPKTFDVLRYMIEHAGRLITHDELLGALWRGIHVQPEVLKSHVLAIRIALEERADGSHFIQTERGRGYRFIGSIPMSHSAADPLRSHTDTNAGTFVGRADMLRELLASLRKAVSGQPQAVFISGEPGIGKTALIQRFLRDAASTPGLAVARGQCIESFAGAEPYTPVLEAFSALCKGSSAPAFVQALTTIAPTWAAQMPAQLPAGQRAVVRPQTFEGARGSMAREAGMLIDKLATDNPLVMILEDLHWADYATIDLLSALCRRNSAARFMLVASYRPEDLKTARHPLNQITRDLAVRNLCREIVLEPLSDPEIADLLTGTQAADNVPGDLARRIQEHCSGNPLFIRITLDHLAERNLIKRTDRGWQTLVSADHLTIDMAPNLGRLIEARFDGLDADQRLALEAASVAGVRFDAASTTRAAGLDEHVLETIFDTLARRDSFVRRAEVFTLPNNELVRGYVFNHEILRRVLYNQIGETRRAGLHRAIGERLEDLYPPDQRNALGLQLAAHFTAARDWPRALAYLRAALHVAASRLARRDALAILDQAVELAANLPETAGAQTGLEFLERRAELLAAGRDPQAQGAYELLVAQAAALGDTDRQIRALLGLSYVLSWHDPERSLRSLDEVLILSGSLEDPLKQDVTRVTAYCRRIWGAGWNRDDARRCEEAFVRLRNHGSSLAVARAEIYFSMICILSTRYRESHDLVSNGYRTLREAAEGQNQTDLARVAWMHHVGVPWSLFSLGEFREALDAFETSIAAYQKNGDDAAAQSLAIYRGVVFFHMSAYEDAVSACEPVAREYTVPRTDGHPSSSHVLPLEQRIALIFCGLAREALGQPEAALRHLLAADQHMAGHAAHLDWYWRLPLEWGLLNAYTALGDIAAARMHADRLCGLALKTEERAWQALAWEGRARVALSSGDRSSATSAVQKALAACEGAHLPIAEWRVHATAAAACSAAGDDRTAAAHRTRSAATRHFHVPRPVMA